VSSALEALTRGAQEILDRPLTGRERNLFVKYLNLLIKWQKSQRLVGSAEPGWIIENLFLDSLLFLGVLPARFGSLLDLGSGAGLPGIPIKIVRPEIQLVLLESRQRRVSFLSSAVRELALERVSVVSGRAEEFAEKLAERFDVRDFHDVVLGSGALPLDVLEANVDAWIARVKAGAGVTSRDR